MRIVIASDFHYGLKSAGFDRTPEIHRIVEQIVGHMMDNKVDRFICCGDICHRANPPSEVHARLFKIYQLLEDLGIETRIIVGNHDANKQRPWGCLAPMEEAGYENVVSHSKIYSQPAEDNWNFIYLPFPFAYELTEEEFLKHVELCGPYNIAVFSHLAVDGASLAGDFILRGASNSIPKFVLEHPQVKVVFNGHIHIPQTVGKVEIIGSPFQTDFGDTSGKSFLDVELYENGTYQVTKVPTDHDKLVQIDLDWSGTDTTKSGTILMKKEWHGSIIKLNIKCREEQIEKVQAFGEQLKKVAKFVRPFVPIIVREAKQAKTVIKAGMTDEEAIRGWVEAKEPVNSEQVLQLALEALEN